VFKLCEDLFQKIIKTDEQLQDHYGFLKKVSFIPYRIAYVFYLQWLQPVVWFFALCSCVF
jgi:hypothetical protein